MCAEQESKLWICITKKSAPEDSADKPVQGHVVHFRVRAPQMPGADVSALFSIPPEN